MDYKKLIYEIDIKSTKPKPQNSLPVVYTNDLLSIDLQFKLMDTTPEELSGATAKILLFMYDGSFFENTAAIGAGEHPVINFKLPENQGNHAGVHIKRRCRMLNFNGKEWTVPKYKITRMVVTYDDRPELYPNSTADEVILTAEQQARLEEIRYTEMGLADAENYVLNGAGTPPDTRTDIEKLIDLIPTENMTEDVIAMANRLVATRADAIYGDAKSV